MVEQLIRWLTFPGHALAHEAYVLPADQFHAGLAHTSTIALTALNNPTNLRLTAIITVGVILAYALSILVRQTKFGKIVQQRLERGQSFGILAVRLSFAAAMLGGALTGSFLGPELPLNQLPMPALLRILEAGVGVLTLVGAFTELAAAVALGLFLISAWHNGGYILTYANYLGEILVLLLFGSRFASIDGRLFGPNRRFHALQPYESVIIRILYGFALAYAAINIKFLHPQLTLDVVNTYHLTQFRWLFPSDPLLVTLGAAMAETMIGVFILIGFEVRLTVLISLFYITLSLLYFREAVWPHLMLYGISINLLLTPSKLSLESWINSLLTRWQTALKR